MLYTLRTNKKKQIKTISHGLLSHKAHMPHPMVFDHSAQTTWFPAVAVKLKRNMVTLANTSSWGPTLLFSFKRHLLTAWLAHRCWQQTTTPDFCGKWEKKRILKGLYLARKNKLLKTYFLVNVIRVGHTGLWTGFPLSPIQGTTAAWWRKKGFLVSETHAVMSAHKTMSTESPGIVTVSILLGKL